MKQYRTVLEVFKWTSPKSILVDYSEVSHLWGKAASSDELWDYFCEESHFSQRPANKPPKQWFRTLMLEQCIPLLSSTCATVISIPSMASRIVEFDHSATIDISSVYCFIRLGAVLCCGGCDSNSVNEVNILSGQVVSKSPMVSSRNWPGIVRHSEFVYVIGGSITNAGYVQSGEKYDISSDSWSMLKGAPKQPRDGFTPFVHQGKLYCVGHWKFIETMDLKSELFAIEKLQMPHACDHWTVAVPYRSQVTIVKTASVLRYRLDPLCFVSRKYTKKKDMYCSNCPPVKVLSHFYYIANKNLVDGIMRLDAETGETMLVLEIDP